MTRRFVRPRPPGIRMQLTLWFGIAFAVLILLTGIILFIELRTSLISSFDDGLHYRTDALASGITYQTDTGWIILTDADGQIDFGTTPVPAQPTSAASPTPTPVAVSGQAAANQASVQTPPAYTTLVRVLDPSGAEVYLSKGFHGLGVPASAFTQALGGMPWSGSVTASDGQTWRVYSVPLVESGDRHVFGVVQVAESLGPLLATLRRIETELLIAIPIVLLLDLLGSFWLAGRALRPIERLAQEASSIEASTLRNRVPVPRAHDEVRRLALTFNDMMDRLDKAFERQRRFVADAAHELRTPIAAIRGISDEILTHGAIPPQDTALLDEINAETVRLSRLISDLLGLARVDEGQVRLEHELVHLRTLATNIVATVEPRAAERGIALRMGQLESVCVLGDEARLMQAVLNLLDNAIAYSDPGGRIELSLTANDEYAWISVCDTGIGIAAEHLPHIFERFYRADAARARATGGVGLGLAIVEWVVRAHDGALDVQSEPDQGTRVTMRLPLAPESSIHELSAQASA